MGNCLVTKLKGAVQNSNLPYIGALTIHVKKIVGEVPQYANNLYVNFAPNTTGKIKVVDNTKSFNVRGTDYTEYLVSASEVVVYVPIVFANENYDVIVEGKYNIFSTGDSVHQNVDRTYQYDLSELNYSDKLNNISTFGQTPIGTFCPKVDMLDLKELQLNTITNKDYAQNVDIEAVAAHCPNLTNYVNRAYQNEVNFNAFASFKKLSGLMIIGSNTYGDVDEFAALAKVGRDNNTSIALYISACNIYDEGNLVNNDYIISKGGTNRIVITFDSSAPSGYTKAYL